MKPATGTIRVTDDGVYITNLSFKVTPGVIDTGGLPLYFANCYSEQHDGLTFERLGDGSRVADNAFGVGPRARKPWWRLW